MTFSFFASGSRDLAIDLGTANTLIYAPGQGIILDEPSIVAVETFDGEQRVIAVGTDAQVMEGKTASSIQTYRPLTGGVINELVVAEEMMKHFIYKATSAQDGSFHAGEVVVCVPSKATSVERRAIQAAGINAGARRIRLIEEPMAAAIGAGLPVTEPIGSMVVDIGGGTTEVGIVSLRALIYGTSERVAGETMDDAIASYVRREHNLVIGSRAAERIKKEIGSAEANAEGQHIVASVSGSDISTGRPREISLNQAEVAEALKEPVYRIVEVVLGALEHAEPEIAADVIERGIMMTGGGSLLRNIDQVLADETGLQVQVAEEPLRCVALGAGRTLEDSEFRRALCDA